MLTRFITFLIFILFSVSTFSQKNQKIVYLDNPSFEDTPSKCAMTSGWESLRNSGTAQATTHPDNFFLVNKEAFDGKTYVGLTTSSDNSSAGIGQFVSPALLPNTCYYFSVFLCRSATYANRNEFDTEWVNHHHPIQLEIWGGLPGTPKNELLAKSEGILNTNWLEYHFKIIPEYRHKYVSFEAHYIDGSKKYYNGNILIDFASHFKPMHCGDEVPNLEFDKIKTDPVPSDSAIIAEYEALNETLMELPEILPTHEKILENLWQDVQFYEGSIELTEAATEAIPKIVEEIIFWDSPVKIVVVKGEDEIRDYRIEILNELIEEVGLKKKYYSIKPIHPSDLNRDWFMKNPYIWVRFDE